MNSVWVPLANSERFRNLVVDILTENAEEVEPWRLLYALHLQLMDELFALSSTGLLTVRDSYSDDAMAVLAEVLLTRAVSDEELRETYLEVLEEEIAELGEESVRASVLENYPTLDGI